MAETLTETPFNVPRTRKDFAELVIMIVEQGKAKTQPMALTSIRMQAAVRRVVSVGSKAVKGIRI